MDTEDSSDARLPFGKGASSANPTMLIIGAEDEEFENDLASQVDDTCSHFQCIDLLKDRPTYLIIFLHHVILQFDASSVLCYLHGEMFKGANIKDARRMFVDYFHMFLDRAAILKVSVPPEISFELDRCRPDMLVEESLRNIVKAMQKALTQEIFIQLEDFRNKRMMGMTIGEKELSELDADRDLDRETMDLKEKAYAEQLLPKVEEATANTDDEKSTTIYNAIVTYMKYLGVKTKEPRVLEKKRHFLMRRKGPNPRKEVEAVKADEKKRKGIGSILDLRRQTRNDPTSSVDPRPDSVKLAIDRKNSSLASRFQSDSLVGKHKASVDGSEAAGTLAPASVPSRDDVEGESVNTSGTSRTQNDNQSFRDSGESSQRGGSAGEQLPSGDGGAEDGTESERLSGKLGRSASLRTYSDRRRSHKGTTKGKQPRSRSDVDVQAAARASDLQSQNVDPGGSGGSDGQPSFLPAQPEDSGPRVTPLETEPSNWRQLVSGEQLLRLRKSEVKRQEVINELIITEHAHMRMLKVLYEVFYQRMLAESILTGTELQSIFPSLDELIEVHASFYNNMKKIRQDNDYLVMEIGDTLLAMFHGTEGDWFKKLASRFCSVQSYALELIKSKSRKDPRFSQFIQDAQSNPQCRRLQLKDIIPIEMQRLTKYPLLLENIAKYTEEGDEKQKAQQAAECCRNILKDVNQEVRDMENLRRLNDYQRRLDVTNLKQSTDPFTVEYIKNLDLTQKRMEHEGPLVWRLTKEKAIDVHVLLLDDSLVLMQKVDERMVLKCHSKNSSSTAEGKQLLCPIVKLGSVLARDVATDRKAFFIIFQTSTGAQIYELVAPTVSERRSWCDKIRTTQEALNLMKPSMTGRNSLVPPQGNAPLSPTEPMMSSENGFSSRERIGSELTGKLSDGLPQDGGAGESGMDERPPTEALAQLLAEQLKANDVDPAKLASGPTERWADEALEDVHRMKWELCSSKRTSLGEVLSSGGEQREGTPADPGESSGQTEDGEETPEGTGDGEEQEDWEAEDGLAKSPAADGVGGPAPGGDEPESGGAPVVLSRDQVEKIERKMNSLVVKLQRLKAVEEEHLRMKQVLVALTMAQGNSLGNYRMVSGERW
ncbi:rho guanine nucleotide exchange factor 1 isoform X2 [Mobula birostris]|uniref:rho guanine nucleotide exchange factor 1 isoform X2 n=1 Tax=Mobula birostris TaxID=1983395 RepID=UPI003B289E39